MNRHAPDQLTEIVSENVTTGKSLLPDAKTARQISFVNAVTTLRSHVLHISVCTRNIIGRKALKLLSETLCIAGKQCPKSRDMLGEIFSHHQHVNPRSQKCTKRHHLRTTKSSPPPTSTSTTVNSLVLVPVVLVLRRHIRTNLSLERPQFQPLLNIFG